MFTDVSGHPISPVSKGQGFQELTVCPLNIEPIFCPETSLDYHQTMPRIFPEQRRSQPTRYHHYIFNAEVAIGAEETGKIERC